MTSNGVPSNVQSVITQINTRDNDGTLSEFALGAPPVGHRHSHFVAPLILRAAPRPSPLKQRMTRFWNRLRCVRDTQTAPVHQDQMVVVRVRPSLRAALLRFLFYTHKERPRALRRRRRRLCWRNPLPNCGTKSASFSIWTRRLFTALSRCASFYDKMGLGTHLLFSY